MLYPVLKPFVRDATRRFFREIHVRGEPFENGPVLIAANHVNVVLDGLLLISIFRRDLWFIVKGAIFHGAIICRVLDLLHLTPVYRRRDNPDEMNKNEGAFRRVVERLAKDGAVLIFPEGESHTSWRMAPLHTGAARIALQGQHDFGEQRDLRIQPVGFTYSDFFAFNSSVTVCLGKPIEVRDYLESYDKDAEESVRELTKDLAESLKALTVDFSGAENLELLEMVNKLYQSKGDDPDDRHRLTSLREALTRLEHDHPMRMKDFEQRLRLHFELSASLKIDGSEKLETRQSKFFMACIAPFVLLGIAALFIPYRLSWWLSRRLSAKDSQYSSWALSVAFFLFPLWYLFLGFLACFLSGSLVVGMAAIFVLIGAGYFTSKYFNRFALYVFTMLWPGRKSPLDVLRDMRDCLVAELEAWQKV